MATPRTVLWVDSLNNRLVNGWRGFTSAQKPRFRQGDSFPLVVRWIDPPMIAASEMEEQTLASGESYSVLVGKRGEKPFSGTWYASYGGDDSPLIAWDASPADVADAINRIPSVSNAGGVYVSQANNGVYKVSFLLKGTRSAFTVNGDSLFPVSEAEIKVITAGSETAYCVLSLALRQKPLAIGTNFVDEAACVAQATQLKQDIWDLSLSTDAKDGYFTFSINAGQPIKCSVFEDYLTLQAKVGSDFTVTKEGDFRWRIAKNDGSAFTATIVSSSEIVSFGGKVCTLSLDTQAAYEFLSGAQYADSVLEVARTWTGGQQMIVQVACQVSNKVYS